MCVFYHSTQTRDTNKQTKERRKQTQPGCVPGCLDYRSPRLALLVVRFLLFCLLFVPSVIISYVCVVSLLLLMLLLFVGLVCCLLLLLYSVLLCVFLMLLLFVLFGLLLPRLLIVVCCYCFMCSRGVIFCFVVAICVVWFLFDVHIFHASVIIVVIAVTDVAELVAPGARVDHQQSQWP